MVMGWAGTDSDLSRVVIQQSEACLRVYQEDPSRIEEDAAIELSYAEGGYRTSQLNELMQNATDAMRETPGRIEVVLTQKALYVANEGAPFRERGVATMLASHLSRKSEEDIGQYGLGFKSVLAVSHEPAVYSRSGSFTFNRNWARRRIIEAGMTAPRYPVLRMAQPIDPSEEAASDPALSNLMHWASTVVKLPLWRGREQLANDLAKFPAEFMLFAPQVRELKLDDRVEAALRTIRLEGQSPSLTLINNDSRSSWFVSKRRHALSSSARRDAGEMYRRSAVDVVWAAPMELRRDSRLGEFWAHFPTGLRTTLSGIVNAPWKLTADRLSMIDGDYNRELLTTVLPGLVAQALPHLIGREDPAGILDLLPARGDEPRSLGDQILNLPVMQQAAKSPSLPDQTGNLRQPATLTLHPRVPSEWMGDWTPEEPRAWVHGSVDSSNERRAKAERLIELGRGNSVSLTGWLESMVTRATPQGSTRAINLAARIIAEEPRRAEEVRGARIVLLENGDLSYPVRGRVFIREGQASADHDFLHPELWNQPELRAALSTLGIEVLNPAGELRASLQRIPREHQWSTVWALLSRVDVETALEILREELPSPMSSHVYARAKSGKWRPIAMLFLPGEVVAANSASDADFVIDAHHHGSHFGILERCGAVSSPRITRGADEAWLRAFRDRQAENYRKAVTGPKPALDKLIVRGPDIPWPLETLPLLSREARLAASEAVLRLGVPERWTVLHPSNAQFKPRQIKSPSSHRLYEYGYLPTTIGPAETQLCLHPDAPVPDEFPKAQVSDGWARELSLSTDLSHWQPEDWQAFILRTETRRPDDVAVVYAWAARNDVGRPAQMLASIGSPSHRGKRLSESIAVTNEHEVHRSLLLGKVPAIKVASESDLHTLIERWGMADGRDMLKEQIVPVPDSDPVLLLDRFPPLRLYDRDIPDLDLLELQTCSGIDIFVSTPEGQQARRTNHHRDGNRILVVNGSDTQVIERIASVLEVRLNAASILEEIGRQATNARVRAVRSQESIPEKLVAAIDADALRRHVPGTAITDLEVARHASLTALELAELALAVYGYDVLKELRGELADAGLQPPTRWAGGSEARKFVESLDFPVEYAGFPGTSLSAVLDVEGPVTLPPLHDYQTQVVSRIHELLLGSAEQRRGMVTLPTGAGKTRVAVEAVVRLASNEKLKGPVLWIAQTEELCEQAVQAWSYVWRALGNGPMQISRFWDRNSAEEAGYGVFQIVVCTMAKLLNAVDDQRYEWMRRAGLIIIDEAHGAITTSYTQVLTWLGGERNVQALRTPLLGLTATAFRGTNETETERLVNRFGANKLDAGVFGEEDPYEYLQRMGILAQVRQKTLEGMDIEIREQDRQQFEQMKRLSPETESLVGQNSHRNGVILDSLIDQPDDWTTLLFATSVEHAKALAAELSYYDVPARAIHGNTDSALRRRYIEEFRAGDIRVLTNFNVLTQGFDAPRVQAVYVTRPTFTPNLYQQMIGRGLRGPLNGGSDEVLIVNVDDNLIQYGDQLAFRHFDYLWSQTE